MTIPRSLRKIEDILKAQARCLRAGDLAGATALAPSLERLIDRLEAAGPPPEPAALEPVRDLATRNADLIAAARRGVEAARRLAGRGAAEGFRTYDAEGRPRRIGPAESG